MAPRRGLPTRLPLAGERVVLPKYSLLARNGARHLVRATDRTSVRAVGYLKTDIVAIQLPTNKLKGSGVVDKPSWIVTAALLDDIACDAGAGMRNSGRASPAAGRRQFGIRKVS